MKIGDLVKKRWGKIEPHEQGTAGVYIGNYVDAVTNPAFDGYWIKVYYPGQKLRYYKSREFEVVSNKIR